MLSLRPTVAANLIRHQMIGANVKVAVVGGQRAANDTPLLDRCKHSEPVVMAKRFGRTYRKWHHWPNDFLPFYWQRQKKTPGHLNGGDLVQDIGTWDPKALILDATYSEELKNAPEVVRKQFTLEFARRKEIVNFQRHHIMEAMARHPLDKISAEARITNYTVKIRNLLHHFLKVDYWDARMKIVQNVFILKRKKMLKELYYTDRERFDRLCKNLMIEFTPEPLGVPSHQVTRKGELRRLTREYCDKMKNDKLEQYHQKLVQEQVEFEAKKAEIEQWIKSEEKFLGLTPEEANSQKK